MNNLPKTASANLALLRENERRFMLEVEKIKRSFGAPIFVKFDEMTDQMRSVPRSRSLVKLTECPVFVMYMQLHVRGLNYSAIDPTCMIWIFDRAPFRFYAKVTTEEWRGVYGSKGR